MIDKDEARANIWGMRWLWRAFWFLLVSYLIAVGHGVPWAELILAAAVGAAVIWSNSRHNLSGIAEDDLYERVRRLDKIEEKRLMDLPDQTEGEDDD